jgi:hypothetical protein
MSETAEERRIWRAIEKKNNEIMAKTPMNASTIMYMLDIMLKFNEYSTASLNEYRELFVSMIKRVDNELERRDEGRAESS